MTVSSEMFSEPLEDGRRRSANVLVPLIMELVRPSSVVDVGCGLGTWLEVFSELGVNEILGIDSVSVDPGKLAIRGDQFVAHDLKEPIRLARRFDLALSLEVAEHLPEESAAVFVDSLTGLAPLVLFSAAIPSQAGIDHVNEQWPEYWAEHFDRRGYVTVDCIRKKVWQNENVERWYVQNILLFVSKDRLADYPLVKSEYSTTSLSRLSLVHPRQLLKHQADIEERDEVIRGLQNELHTKVGECNEIIKDLHARLQAEVAQRDRVISELQAKLQSASAPSPT